MIDGGILDEMFPRHLDYRSWVLRNQRKNKGKASTARRDVAATRFRVEHILVALLALLGGFVMAIVAFIVEIIVTKMKL